VHLCWNNHCIEVYVLYVMFSPQNLLGNKKLHSSCQGQNFSRRSRTVWHPHYLPFTVEEFKTLRSQGRSELGSHVCRKALSAKRVLLLLSDALVYHEADLFVMVCYVVMWLFCLTRKWLQKSDLETTLDFLNFVQGSVIGSDCSRLLGCYTMFLGKYFPQIRSVLVY
jgi:hypothetical protein